jgi:anaerobic selenocysteine-containing dehydrogenase
MVGRPGAGMMPIRGHSNVQGIGSVGVTPKLKDAIFQNLQSRFGIELPTTEGLDTMGCMEAANDGRVRFGFCLGGNLFGSNPAQRFAAEALSKLDTLVYLNTTLNTGHAWGTAGETLILPVLARDEEPQSTTQESMFNYVRLSDGGPRRHEGPKSEIEVISRIADATLGESGPVNWSEMENTNSIRAMIAATVPGFEQIERIGETKQEFQISGRTFHEPQFSTPDGKARLRRHELPELMHRDNAVRMMTVRSEGQFNTVVYDEEDLYRGQDRRDIILLHPDDLARRNLQENQRVAVRSETGAMQNILVRSFAQIKPGNALMYYPEANVLVSRHADPQSKTPAFKNVLVTVEAMSLAMA